jgi:hypothetical protein
MSARSTSTTFSLDIIIIVDIQTILSHIYVKEPSSTWSLDFGSSVIIMARRTPEQDTKLKAWLLAALESA